MSVPSLRTVAAGVAIISAACAASLALGEVALRLLVPADTRHFIIRPGTHAVFRPSAALMPGVSGVAHYSVNSQGIRGREFGPRPQAEYRMLAVGGSTTELLYLADSETWEVGIERLLERTPDGRAVWVGNVGRSGMNARDHAVQLKYLLAEYPHLDAVMVLAGVNDLSVALAQGTAYRLPPPVTDTAAERAQARRAFEVAPGRLSEPATEYFAVDHAPWFKRTACWQLLKRARMSYTSARAARGLLQDSQGQVLDVWRAHRRGAARIVGEPPDLRLPLTEYRRELATIADMASARRMRLILMTQPALWRKDLSAAEEARLWLGGIGRFQTDSGLPYYSSAALATAMRRYNETLLDVCRERGLECIDLAARVPRDTTAFYDDVHFTERGAAIVATEIASYLRERPPFTTRQVAGRER